MNLPAPVHPNPYAKYLKIILESAMQNCEESMSRAAQDIVGDNSTTTDIALSIDGSWQKRYVYNSLLGATVLISIDNGRWIIQLSAKHAVSVKKIQILP